MSGTGLGCLGGVGSVRVELRQRLVLVGLCAAIAAGLAAVALRLGPGLDSTVFAPIVGAAVAATFLLGRRRGAGGLLAAYFVALAFFTQLRDAADETGAAALSDYVIDWELWMFGGVAPSAWLQARLGGVGPEPGWIAYLSAFVHWMWFVFPHAVVVGAYLFARRHAARVILTMTAVFYLGVTLYFLTPTAPPWMAAENGLLDGVVRAMHNVGPAILGESLYTSAFDALAEPNPSAAMPSLHFAASFVAVLIGLVLRSRALVAVSLAYSLALAFALVYLGEHYVADILAGAGVAAIAFLAVELSRSAWRAAAARRAQLAAAARRSEERLREALRRPGRRLQAS